MIYHSTSHKYILTDLYREVSYWHGTGRFHYHHSNESRYEDARPDKKVDILDSIVVSGGLLPHRDPWIRTIRGTKTISLTNSRIYALLYAGIHQYEKDSLLYKFNSPGVWVFRVLFTILFEFVKNPLQNVRDFLRILPKDLSVTLICLWAQAVRKPKGSSDKILSIWSVFNLRSDIPGNYPILIGIKKDGVARLSINPFVDKFETRTDQPVSLQFFTHIEVPQGRIKETEAILQANGVMVPVIPLEVGALHYHSRLSYLREKAL